MAKLGFSALGFSEMCGSPVANPTKPSVHVIDKQNTSPIRADVTLTARKQETIMADAGGGLERDSTSPTRADVTGNDCVTVVGDAGGEADVNNPKADVTHKVSPSIPIATGGNSNMTGTRVSVWERLSQPNDETKDVKQSFASIVGSVPKPELEFFPMEKDAKLRVQIPKALTQGMVNTYKSVLYGYFLGPRIPFPVVLRAVQNAWGKFGFKDAMMNEHGTFFFQFNTVGGCSQVIESSPLMIKGVPLFVYPWDPFKGLHKPEHTTCHLWIKFYNIPLVAFNREGISRIASAVGVPLRMDACTAATCDKAWGRTNFAKVLVNVWASGKLAREVEVAIPHLIDDGEEIVSVVLEYDWEPTQCSNCKVFGHKDSLCPKATSPQVIGGPKQHKGGDGFQYPHRKQWRPKQATRQIGEGETSNVKKDVVINNKDTMMGVGTVKRVVEQKSGQKNGEPTPNITNKGAAQPKVGTELPPRNKDGYCTLNAGRTPGAKEGMAQASSTDKGEQVTKKETPNLLQSVVATFKQFEKAKRGTPLSVVTSNSFERYLVMIRVMI